MSKKKEVIEVIEPVEEVTNEVGENLYYMAKVGDTLESIAKKYETTKEELEKLNGFTEIYSGNQVRVK